MDTLTCLWNLRFTAYYTPIIHNGIQPDMLLACWQDTPLYRQYFGRLLKSSLHIACHFSHSCYKQIAEAMAGKSAITTKTMLKQLLHKRLSIS